MKKRSFVEFDIIIMSVMALLITSLLYFVFPNLLKIHASIIKQPKSEEDLKKMY